ncbi:MAG: aminotransferase class I/II-fold pyridoxal phosphate-dependent enzyme [Deltaproteobacteria bacterium]|nr:aminotransferase class I/II-fold pyridoxal phosphate-dependent enzyme [Deltaproteobacteria bacterium]
MRQPIAIVGMACRFGGANDLHAYWEQAREGRDAFAPVPPDRWDTEVFLSDNPRATDKSYAPHGAWIDDIRAFPALALKIPPRRVEVMDPQQRLSLELALQVFDDAGIAPAEIAARCGVYMGVTATEYRSLLNSRATAALMASGHLGSVEDPEAIARAVERVVPSRPLSAPGALGNMVAATVAQELDLKGPAYTTDAACASAAVAVADAVANLRAGTIDAAVAGGVYICITPDHHIVFSRIGAMSKSGYCRPFDSRADGFVQGDGGGVVLLERLEDAIAKGRRIYAVIEGVSSNNDGRGDGPMAPLDQGQTDVILDGWRDAGLDPMDLGYHEAHGTGTAVGDPTEFKALNRAIGDKARRVALGSSKANIGHTMSGAGVAGLIRAALAVHHSKLPPMAGFEKPRDDIPLEGSPFFVPTREEPWEAERRYASVSSFGFGGTNGFIVLRNLEEAEAGRVATVVGADLQAAPAEQVELVLMSAGSEADLRGLATRTAKVMESDSSLTLAGLARAWAGRPRQSVRLGLTAASREEAIARLRAVGAGEAAEDCFVGEAAEHQKLAFLYPGQGAQRPGMISGIRDRFPVVARTLAEIEAGLGETLSCPLTHLLYPERRAEKVDDETAAAELTATENCQPALLAVGVALTRLLESVGVRPAVVTGHSLGEMTAAVAGGVLTPAGGAAFVAERGRRMAALPGDHGAMCALMTSPDKAEALLVPGAVLANFNHPRQVVASGTTEAIGQVLEKAAAAKVKAVALEVSHGFHSPALDALDCDDLVDGLEIADPADVVCASAIDEVPYADAAAAREVFRRHARAPVLFERAVEECLEAGATIFLQVGAGGPLAAFARGCLPKGQYPVLSLAGIEDEDGGRSLMATLARLFTLGVDLDPRPITAPATVASVPPVVWPTERYWGVKDSAQLGLEVKLSRSAGQAPAEAAKVVAEAPAASPAAPADSATAAVVAAVAKASAYPESSVRMEMTLVDDLGFDSLMVADLVEDLVARVEGLSGVEQDFFLQKPTVGMLVEYVETHQGQAAEVVDDDAPLAALAPIFRPLPLPGTEPATAAGVKILISGDDEALRVAVAAALEARGEEAREVWTLAPEAAATDGVADLVVWCAASGARPDEDRAAALLAALAHQAREKASPDLLLLRREQDASAEALSGVVRAVAKEWPEARTKALSFAEGTEPAAIAARVLTEWRSDDRSVDVCYRGDERLVAGLAPLAAPQPLDLAGETFLVSGGTRGIGGKLAARLLEGGARVVLLGRSAPSAEMQAVLEAAGERASVLAADVTDRAALEAALEALPGGRPEITRVIHAAGVLADGALESVKAEAGALARAVKVQGFGNLIAVAGKSLRHALAIGSWAGRFGNKHQAHYAAANAGLAGLTGLLGLELPVVVAEFGPWSDSEMVATIPEAVQAAMRAEGVDFVGTEAGLAALIEDLARPTGVVVHGRRLPLLQRRYQASETLSVETHPYLLDHALEGTPVLPLAAAADLLADAGGLTPPFELRDLRLFGGVAVAKGEGTRIGLEARGGKLRLTRGEKRQLAYEARVAPLGELELPPPREGGEAPGLSLKAFYDEVTFHGPLLQGITAIEGVGEDFVRGRVRTGLPRDWIPGTHRERWSVDPLALDSAMQLSGYVAWTKLGRAGTPVSIGRLCQLAPLPAGEVLAEVTFDAPDPGAASDRFVGTVRLRDASGQLLLLCEEVVANLEKAEAPEVAASEAGPAAAPSFDPASVDPGEWPEVKDLELRLSMAEAAGIANPYFRVHQGTARDTSTVDGRALKNFSSYNYLGLSGDPRVVEQVGVAVARYGTSVSASRVASGERPFHGELEKELAAAQGAEDALVFTAGHATNVNAIGHLFGEKDLVLHDELIHDSILQGIHLSGAARRGFRHDDPSHLEAQLAQLRGHYEKVLIVVEGVYSMDGDVCQLPAYVELKERYGCLLMVDEAHSFGVIGATGRGVGEHHGVPGSKVDLWMGTLSKSLASCGGWIAGSERLVRYLRYTAPGFVYSAGLTPANGVAALASLRLMLAEPERVTRLQEGARRFRQALVDHGVDTGPARGESAVVPAVTGNSMHALLLSARLLEQGINVQPIMYPAVADDAARLRFFLSCLHTDAQLDETAEAVATTLAKLREEMPA